MLADAEALLSSGVVSASAWETGATTTRAQVDVRGGEFVPPDATGFLLIREPSFFGGVDQVVALRSEKEVVRPHAFSVIAGVANDASIRDSTVVDLPGIPMCGHVASRPEATVAAGVQQSLPLPTPFGFPDICPESCGYLLGGFWCLRLTDINAFGHRPIYA